MAQPQCTESDKERKAKLRNLYNKLVTFEGVYAVQLSQSGWIKALKALTIGIEENEMVQVFKLIVPSWQRLNVIKQSDWNRWVEFELCHAEHPKLVNKLEEAYNSCLQNISRDVININALCCYQWRLPKYMPSEIDLLCCGYCRSTSSVFIPYDIVRIYMHYLYDNIIEKFKNTQNNDCFKSGIFNYKSCKFYFELYLRRNWGYYSQNVFIGNIEWIDGPRDISKIEMDYKLLLQEKFMEVMSKQTIYFDAIGDSDQICQFPFDDVFYLNSLTFNFCIESITVYKNDDHNILFEDELSDDDEIKTLKPIVIDESMFGSNIFTWYLSDDIITKIQNAKPKDTIQSPIFSLYDLNWQIWLYPNGDRELEIGQCHIIIHLISLPAQIKSVRIYYEMMFDQQILSAIDSSCTFSETSMKSWNSNVLKTADMTLTNKERRPTFTISMELLAILNKDGNNMDLNDLQITNNPLVSLPMKTFKWEISSSLLQQIKRSTPTTSFFSSPFKIYAFHFILELFPNRNFFDYDEDDDFEHKPNACIFQLHLLTIPINIASISMNYVLRLNDKLKEVNTKFSWITQISSNYFHGHFQWDDDQIYFTKLKQLNSLTFCCDIQLLDVNFVNNMKPNNNMNQDIETNVITLPEAQYFKWIISSKYYNKNIPIGNVFRSETFIIFGIEWYIWFIPKPSEEDDMHFHICCAYLPQNVSQISCHCKVIVNEINFAVSTIAYYNDDKMENECLDDLLPRDKIEDLDQLSFRMEMILCSVYDEKGNDVTNIYAEYSDNLENMSEEKSNQATDSIDSYFWEIDELEKLKQESPYFEIMENKQRIEFKVQLYITNEYGLAEIFISIKSLPKEIKRLSLMCGVLIFKMGSQRYNVNIGGAVHFTQNKLTSLLIDAVELELDDAKQVTFIVNMQQIAIYENDYYEQDTMLLNDYYESSALILLDSLLKQFSVSSINKTQML